MRRLVLASQSVHRLELLRNAGYEVEVVAHGMAEPDPAEFADIEAALVHIALLKARAARRRGARGLIFGADTVGFARGEVLGKPADRPRALRMLEAISDTVHQVLTGWCLLRTRDGLEISGVERTTITMRPWTREEIAAYLDSNQWVGKSGAYGLQLPDDPFVTHIDGSRSNVVGVPLERLEQIFAEVDL